MRALWALTSLKITAAGLSLQVHVRQLVLDAVEEHFDRPCQVLSASSCCWCCGYARYYCCCCTADVIFCSKQTLACQQLSTRLYCLRNTAYTLHMLLSMHVPAVVLF
jgi:hypothetical protein